MIHNLKIILTIFQFGCLVYYIKKKVPKESCISYKLNIYILGFDPGGALT